MNGPREGDLQVGVPQFNQWTRTASGRRKKRRRADTSYVQQDPHVFFAKVESANIEWSFTVDEALTTR